jgi:hypothetical protein
VATYSLEVISNRNAFGEDEFCNVRDLFALALLTRPSEGEKVTHGTENVQQFFEVR